VFYYKQYSKHSISEIIETAVERKKDIELCSNINALLKNEESDYDIYKRKQNMTTLIITVVVLIVIYVINQIY
jgi:predicted CopG family antitoxin